MQHCIGGAAGAVTRSAVLDTPGRALLTHDVGPPRQPARMSHHPVDLTSPARFACMPRDGMSEIAISAGTASPERTSAYLHLHMPVVYPFYLPHR